MIETQLLQLFSDKKKYDQYRPLIRKEHVTKQTWMLLEEMREWWLLPAAPEMLDWEEFAGWVLLKHGSTLSEDDKLALDAIAISPPVTLASNDILRILNERCHFKEIATMSADISAGFGGFSPDDVKKELEAYYKDVASTEETKDNYDVTALLSKMKSISAGHKLVWRLPELNKSVGPVSKGNLILIAGRPESGKTTLLVHELMGWCQSKDLVGPAIYITNEDSIESIVLRCILSYYEITYAEYEADRTAYDLKFTTDIGAGNLFILDNSDACGIRRWSDVERVCNELKPGVVVIDQLRNVQGFDKGQTEIGRLKDLYSAARILARNHCPIITCHQLKGDAHGILYPTEQMLEGSQTEVQGALDVQIMMGRSFDVGYENTRGLNVVKNKLTGDPGITDPKLRHGKFEITINEEKQLFKGVY